MGGIPEYSGSLQSVELSTTLWVLVALPVIGCVLAGVLRGRLADRVHVATALATLAAAAHHAWVLAELPAGRRLLLDHAWTLVRIGSFDAAFDLSLDPLGAALAVAVGLVAAVAAPRTRNELPRERSGQLLAVASALLLVLGDNLVVAAFAWFGLGLAAWLALGAGGDRPDRASVRMLALGFGADALLIAAGALLFWGTGGEWMEGGDFVPAYRARVAGVEPARRAEQGGRKPERGARMGLGRVGFLTMTSLPGSLVRVGGADLCAISSTGSRGGVGTLASPCRKLARSPFVRLPISAAVHDLRISPGGGADELAAQKVRVEDRSETKIVVTTGTVAYRELRDQLAMRDSSGEHVLAAGLRRARVHGMRIPLAVGLLAFLAGLVKSVMLLVGASRASFRSLAVLASVALVPAGFVLIAKLGPLFSLSPPAGAAVAAGGGLLAVVAARAAAFERDPAVLLVRVAVSHVGLAFLGLGVGAYEGASLHVVGQALAISALLLAASAVQEAAPGAGRSLARLAGLGSELRAARGAGFLAALGVSAAPIPAAAGFLSERSILGTAFAVDEVAFLPGWVAWGLGIVAGALVSFAVWRMYFLTFGGAATADAGGRHGTVSGWSARAPLVLAGSALALAALDFSTRFAGRSGEPALVEAWLAPVFADIPARTTPMSPPLLYGQLAAAFVAALGGWAVARGRYSGSRAASWEEDEVELPGHSLLASGFFAGRVLDAAAAWIRRAGEWAMRFDEAVLDAPAAALARLFGARDEEEE